MPSSENPSDIMFYYVYMLKSEVNGNVYIGYTIDLKRRLMEHNKKLNKSTKLYALWKLIYFEACLNKDDAMRREHYLKTSQGSRLIKRRLKEYFYSSA